MKSFNAVLHLFDILQFIPKILRFKWIFPNVHLSGKIDREMKKKQQTSFVFLC